MDIFSFPPFAAALDAAYSALMTLTHALEPLVGTAAGAAAVILVTLLVRAVLVPAGISQAKGERARALLAPRIELLRTRYGRNPERLRRETMQLYADAGVSPLAGCLPLLLQAPVVGLIYSVFLHTTIGGHTNALLAEQVAGVPLGATAVGALSGAMSGALSGAPGGGGAPASLAVFGVVVGALLVVAELTRRAFPPAAVALPSASPSAPPRTLRWLGVLPFATAVVALFVPLAAALYLVVTTIWTLVQRVVLRRRYPLG